MMVRPLFLSAQEKLVLETARSWIGTPYRHQASTKHIGCDCLGFVTGVWRELGGDVPKLDATYSLDWAECARRDHLLEAANEYLVSSTPAALRPSDILIFKWSASSVSKHLAIYIGENKMLHAFERHAVCEVTLVPSWRRRISGVFRFPNHQ